MSLRSIEYLIDEEGISPQNLTWGGVQYEDNATVVRYKFKDEFLEKLGENICFRIDFFSDCAGYDPSENLTFNGCVERCIPKKFTQYAGKMVSTLVISRVVDNNITEEFIALPAEIFFTIAERDEKKIIENLSAYEMYMLSLLKQAEGTLEEMDGKYVRNTQFADQNGNPGILRIKNSYGISSGRYGSNSPQTGDTIYIVKATNGDIKNRNQDFRPIVPSNLDYAVKTALSDSKLAWSEDEKAKVRALLKVKKDETVLIQDAVVYSANEYTVKPTEPLFEGVEYTWAYYCSEYPGWLVNDANACPVTTRNNIKSIAGNVTVNGQNYIGFYAECFNWVDGSGWESITVYQDGDNIKVYKTFGGNQDTLTIIK